MDQTESSHSANHDTVMLAADKIALLHMGELLHGELQTELLNLLTVHSPRELLTLSKLGEAVLAYEKAATPEAATQDNPSERIATFLRFVETVNSNWQAILAALPTQNVKDIAKAIAAKTQHREKQRQRQREYRRAHADAQKAQHTQYMREYRARDKVASVEATQPPET